MTCWFVSRHAGAVAWARRRGLDAVATEHLALDAVQPGDVVIGTLPVGLAAQVQARGAAFWFLELDLPAEARGRELSADEMERCGARLVEYRVERVRDVT